MKINLKWSWVNLILNILDRPAHNGEHTEGTFVVKSGLAQMCKGGLIMDVVNVEQAKIAEEAGVQMKTSCKTLEIILNNCLHSNQNLYLIFIFHCLLGLCCNGIGASTCRHT